jgi:hypothetical protein
MAVIYRSSPESRKKPRRLAHHAAKIVTDGKARPRNCVVADISEDGARLVLDGDIELPDDFLLLLGKGDGDARRCRLVWRTGATVGVEFMTGES